MMRLTNEQIEVLESMQKQADLIRLRDCYYTEEQKCASSWSMAELIDEYRLLESESESLKTNDDPVARVRCAVIHV